jgi:heavy metal efflux system protein
MLERIPAAVLRNRPLIVLAAIVMIVVGFWAANNLAVDVYPNLNAPVVTVVAEHHGMAPEEIEALVTFPLESAFNALPHVLRVRSSSLPGISLIFIEFDYGTDIYFARQLVAEKLQLAAGRLPAGVEPPFMGPVSSMFADAVEFTLPVGDDAFAARDMAEWTIKPRLQTVQGVSNVINFGGLLKQYQVLLDPTKLITYSVTAKQVFDVLSANNRNFTGGYLAEGTEERLVRGLGRVHDAEDIGNIVVAERNGVPVYVRHVAEVRVGPFIRRGAASENGEEVVAVTVQNQYNANVLRTIEGVMRESEALNKALGQAGSLSVFYTQLDMIKRALANVTNAIWYSAALVVLVLLAFLGSLRTTVIVATAIPLSVVFALVLMYWLGLSLNIMTLGGLAVGIGMMVDASIIVTENVYRHIQRGDLPVLDAVRRGAAEVARPVFFATLVLVAAFAPVFTLGGLEGRMFIPLAFTVSAALVASLVVSLSITLVLSSWLIRPGWERTGATPLVRLLRALYEPLLRFALGNRALMVAIGVALFIAALAAVPRIGSEFMPELDESSLVMDILLPSGTSLEESTRMANRVAREISTIPDVIRVINRTGRAEGAEHAEPVNLTESNIVLVPKEERRRSLGEIEADIREKVDSLPGVLVSLNSPLQHRINHTITGTKAAIAVKLFGDDLHVLRTYAERIEGLVRDTAGATDVQIEQTTGVPQLRVSLDRDRIARYGMNVDDVADVIEIAVAGRVASEVLETRKRYDLFVRFQEPFREREEQIRNILVDTPSGVLVPLAELATFDIDEGPAIIRREGAMRRVMVQCNVDGRDMGSVVADLQQRIGALDLPQGYFVAFGGTYENQIRAMRQLALVVALTIAVVFTLLYVTFRSARHAFLVVFNVPHAMVGGVLMLYVAGMPFSVPAIIGFIALAGVCVQDGIVFINQVRLYREQGLPVEQALTEAGRTKLRPVMLTTASTVLGLIPLVASGGTGAEIQRPLGLVLMAGLVFSTGLTLVVLPTLYSLVERRKAVAAEVTADVSAT